MNRTFIDDGPPEFDVPPIPIDSNNSSQDFSSYALQTQKKINGIPPSRNQLDTPPEFMMSFSKKHKEPSRNPILIQSPRIKDDAIPGRLILSTGDSYIGPSANANCCRPEKSPYAMESPRISRDSYLPPSSMYPVAMNDAPVFDIPAPTPTPARIMKKVRIETANKELAESKKFWTNKVREVEQYNRSKMQNLIKNHVLELRKFDEHNGGIPRAVSAVPMTLELIPKGRNKVLARVPAMLIPQTQRRFVGKNCCTPRQHEASLKRKALITRQQKEVIAMNDDCNSRMETLKERMRLDLEKKRAELSTLSGVDVEVNEDEIIPEVPHVDPVTGLIKVKQVRKRM